jgi:integrase
MGWLEERVGDDGKIRYFARYRDQRGRKRSAGVFANERKANKAWQRAEAEMAAGRIGDPARGRQTLQRYIEDEWFPNHLVEHTTRQGYRYALDRHILPTIGKMRLMDMLPSHLREWVAELQAAGVAPPTIQKCKVIVDAVLTTAFNDQITYFHAGKGVKVPPSVTKPRRIVTVEQFDAIYAAIEDPSMRLLIEVDIETGLRWGELTELRPRDINFNTAVISVERAVVQLNPKFHPEGKRFLVKDYPKDKQSRQVGITSELLDKIKDHIATHGIGRDDLLFQMPQPTGPARRSLPAELPDPSTLGLTEPNERGRRYQHGTVNGYCTAKCRCRHCRDAVAAYRAARRTTGRDQPRQPRKVDTDGHISADWFRNTVWHPAVAAADIGFRVTPHGLRHSHASWLVAGGAHIQVVKERLGHGSIATTGKYLHTMPGAHEAALEALAAVRAGLPRQSRRQPTMDEVMDMMAKFKEMYEALSDGALNDGA